VQILFGKKKKRTLFLGKKSKEKRRVPRRAISTGHRVQETNPSCYKCARIAEESKNSPEIPVKEFPERIFN
jgi:hypothetical protein